MGTATPHEGTTSNRYTILGRLAGGGMADILLARAVNEGGVERYVVLKRVLPERSRDPNFARMFLDEARLASQLHHPNIAQVYDIGKLAGSYFFTMEYVHGEDVRAVLHRLAALERQLPISVALHIAAGSLAALHHAHERTGPDGTQLGVVHRDVSPANLMVSYEGVVKLLDFGVAKAAHRSVETVTGTIKGKIAYLSPEQCQGGKVDRRSDVFSLGVVLYEMLTGTRLYKRDADFATMLAIVSELPPPPSSLREGISPSLDQLVLRTLAKDPQHRFATAADVLEAIETIAARERHVMSATAAGRFVRELFGERPEPWVELRVHGDVDKALTITSESVSHGSVPRLSPLAAPGVSPILPDDDEGAALETQLHETPALWRPGANEDSPADGSPALRTLITTAPQPPVADDAGATSNPPAGVPLMMPPVEAPHVATPPARVAAPPAPPPRVTTPPAGVVAPVPPRIATPPAGVPAPPQVTMPQAGSPAIAAQGFVPPTTFPVYRPDQGAPQFPAYATSPRTEPFEPTPRRRSRGILIAATAGVTVVVVFAAIKLTGSDSSTPPRDAGLVDSSVHDAHDARTPTAADAPSLGAPASDAAPIPDAAVIKPRPQTIAEATATEAWTAVLALCDARPRTSLSDTERTNCGLAACRTNQRAAAVAFRGLRGANRAAIERACKAEGINLPGSTRPRVDPCERDPLKCRK